MTRTRLLVAAAATAIALSACSSAASPGVVDVTPSDAAAHGDSGSGSSPVAFDGTHVAVDAWADAAAEPGVVILDVRTPQEYADGHIAGAVNVDVSAADFAAQVSALDPDVSYAVYCRSGNRSRAAIDAMNALGHTHTVGLDGGIAAWVAAGYAITTD
jgi:phage shock protein E